MRFLCIEDDELNRRVLSEMLNVAGGISQECESGEEGLVALDAADFDCILVDLRMPGMDGHAVIECIRSRSDAKGQLPIIVVTAEGDGADTARCLRSGADWVLRKPVVMDDLFECIGTVLGARNTLVA